MIKIIKTSIEFTDKYYLYFQLFLLVYLLAIQLVLNLIFFIIFKNCPTSLNNFVRDIEQLNF